MATRAVRTPHLLAIVIAFTAILATRDVRAARVHGAFVLDESVKVEEGRYRSRKSWDKTLRFFRSVYRNKPGVVWRTVATPAKVKAIYLENTNFGQGWEGINIYEAQGKTFIYVVKSDTGPVPAKKSKKSKKRRRRKKKRTGG